MMNKKKKKDKMIQDQQKKLNQSHGKLLRKKTLNDNYGLLSKS